MGTVHVLPLADGIVHVLPGGWDGHDPNDASEGAWRCLEALEDEPDPGCPCGPATECVPNADGPDGWLVTHHALDGRELTED